jgi:glycosyltransferase involved in cell wall biosynthesis
MKTGVSIILTAWNTQDYIEECLDSIAKQTFFKKGNHEILLGIDGCGKTLNKVKEIMSKYPDLKVFFFPKNVGTYIVSNTLASIAKYKYIQRFDTDDIMMPDMIKTMFEYAEEHDSDILLCKLTTFLSSPRKEFNSPATGQGQIFFKNEIFTEFGGFMPFKCGADTEFIKRLEKFVKSSVVEKVLVKYRRHAMNLTTKSDTNMCSDYRKNVHGFLMYELENFIKEREDAKIKCVTAACCELDENGELGDPIYVEPINEDIQDRFAEYMALPESLRKKYEKKIISTTVTVLPNGYIRREAQSPWTPLF